MILLLVGVVAGAAPTYLLDRSRWRREQDAIKSDQLQQVFVKILVSATDVRRAARSVARASDLANEADVVSRREGFHAAVASFSEAYHELSILAPVTTYAMANRLSAAVFELLPLVDEGRSESDPVMEELRARVQAARRDLRDHVRSTRGLDDLGDFGHGVPPW